MFQVSSLEAPRRVGCAGAGAASGARLELERRSLDLERELRARIDRDSDASLDDRDHLVWSSCHTVCQYNPSCHPWPPHQSAIDVTCTATFCQHVVGIVLWHIVFRSDQEQANQRAFPNAPCTPKRFHRIIMIKLRKLYLDYKYWSIRVSVLTN